MQGTLISRVLGLVVGVPAGKFAPPLHSILLYSMAFDRRSNHVMISGAFRHR
jgi:hypothetical protein